MAIRNSEYTPNPAIPSQLKELTSASPRGTTARPKSAPETRLPKCPKKSTWGRMEMTSRQASIVMIFRLASSTVPFFLDSMYSLAMYRPIIAQMLAEAPTPIVLAFTRQKLQRSLSMFPKSHFSQLGSLTTSNTGTCHRSRKHENMAFKVAKISDLCLLPISADK